MQATTVRMSPSTRQTLNRLADATHSSVQRVLEAAVETYRRQVFLDQTNLAFAALRQDPAAWAAYLEDLEPWEGTARDGL